MDIIFLKKNSSHEETQALRKKVDCLMIDGKKLRSGDDFIVHDESFDVRLQPLRLVVLRLHELDRSWKIFNDHFKRNTMVIASDDDVRNHPDTVVFLESRGVALLMAKEAHPGFLSYEGLMRSLTSLKFKTLLVEDQIDLIPELTFSE